MQHAGPASAAFYEDGGTGIQPKGWKSNRTSQRQRDTINYDVHTFSPKEINPSRTYCRNFGLSYAMMREDLFQREIRNFYVEGQDLTNGKYKQIGENLAG